MLTVSESDAAECLCGILLHEDWDQCPTHGTKAQEAKAREIRVPPWVSALDEIEQMVERAYYDGRITWQQRGLLRWAARKSREAESAVRCSRCAQSMDGVDEL